MSRPTPAAARTMKFNKAFVSSVLIACTSFTVGEAALPFAPWRTVTNTNLCVQPASDGTLVLATCDPSNLTQLWSALEDGGTIYRLQNGGLPSTCAFVSAVGPFVGEPVTTGECTISGTSSAVSNAQFDTGTALPNVVQLKSHIRFSTTNFCVDLSANNLVLDTCNSASLSQKWILGE